MLFVSIFRKLGVIREEYNGMQFLEIFRPVKRNLIPLRMIEQNKIINKNNINLI